MGSELVQLRCSESSAQISPFGAHVVSWKAPTPSTGDVEERLYLSPLSDLNGPAAIRGGIPIVFPYFGPSKIEELPQHGWARKSLWQVQEAKEDEAVMTISHDGWTLWHKIKLSQYSLFCELAVEIDKDSTFQALFHNYLRASTNMLAIHGLPATFKDKVSKQVVTNSSNSGLILDGETDRVYHNAEREVIVALDESSGSTDSISVQKSGLEDIVVWNPAAEVAKKMKDLPDEDWKDFVCVEPGMATNEIIIKAGERKVVSQTLECI